MPALVRFFDSELPTQLLDTINALGDLREQLEFADLLNAKERKTRKFQLPFVAIDHMDQWRN